MPLYEYVCLHCQHRFEALVKARSENVICPRCQSQKVKKLISSFGIGGNSSRLKGGSGSCSGCSSSSCSTCHQ
ncbi:MAG: zinc ribbon domain-containing protein [Candidatus Saccharicenans sp.]|nr:zinc ribbon domain-containing protein [Candidatus Saccharicenans sp.]NMC65407.1 zinc ribbon domain-containing protein [Acidobacteriota bacterium]